MSELGLSVILPILGKTDLTLNAIWYCERMYEEELSTESDIDLHLKKKEVVQKLAELSQYEQELNEREEALQELRDELTKKEKHLAGWESEIKRIARIVAEEKKRIDKMAESIERLEEEPKAQEAPIEVSGMVPGEVENIPEEAEPLLDEPDEEDILMPEDLLGDELEALEDQEPEERPKVREERKPPKKKPVKMAVKKKKKKFGFFK